MDLIEVRNSINSIDADMKELFDKRFQCTNQVAAIKISEQDKVFKPLREKEISERYADDVEYVSFIKKIMQISRKRQYGIFLDRVAAVEESLLTVKEKLLEKGVLELSLQSDEKSENGLNVKDILSVISDTSLAIKTLNVDETGVVKATLLIDGSDKSIREALILAYMLDEETL